MAKTPKKADQKSTKQSAPAGQSKPSEAEALRLEENKSESLRKLEATAMEVEQASRQFVAQSADQQYVAALEGAISRINQNMAQLQQASASAAYRQYPGMPPRQDGCCDCNDCVSSDCCQMEFVFKKARMTAGQIGIDQTADGETTTGIMGEASGMEVQFYASLNGFGIIVPNQIWRFMKLDKRIFRAGTWYDVDRVIHKVAVPCNQTKTFQYNLQAVEREIGTTEDLILGKNEHGSKTGNVNISCCGDTPVQMVVPLVLDGGGMGRGEVEVMFEIRKAC